MTIIQSFPWHEVQPDEVPLDDVMVQMFVNPENTNNCERITHEAHNCTVLLLQQYGLVLYLLTCVV